MTPAEETPPKHHIPTTGTSAARPHSCSPPPKNKGTCLPSKAVSHTKKSPPGEGGARFWTREDVSLSGTSVRSSRSDPVCQAHLVTQTAVFSFQVLKFKGLQSPVRLPAITSANPVRGGRLSFAKPFLKMTPAQGQL